MQTKDGFTPYRLTFAKKSLILIRLVILMQGEQAESIPLVNCQTLRAVQSIIDTYFFADKLFRFSRQSICISNINAANHFQYQPFNKKNILQDLELLTGKKEEELEIKLVLPQGDVIYLLLRFGADHYFAEIQVLNKVTQLTVIFTQVAQVNLDDIAEKIVKMKMLSCKFEAQKQQSSSLKAFFILKSFQNSDLILLKGKLTNKILIFDEKKLMKNEESKIASIKSVFFLQKSFLCILDKGEVRKHQTNASNPDNYEEWLHLKKTIEQHMRHSKDRNGKYAFASASQSVEHYYFLFVISQTTTKCVLIRYHKSNFLKGKFQKYCFDDLIKNFDEDIKITVLKERESQIQLIFTQGSAYYLAELKSGNKGNIRHLAASEPGMKFGLRSHQLLCFGANNYFQANSQILMSNHFLKSITENTKISEAKGQSSNQTSNKSDKTSKMLINQLTSSPYQFKNESSFVNPFTILQQNVNSGANIFSLGGNQGPIIKQNKPNNRLGNINQSLNDGASEQEEQDHKLRLQRSNQRQVIQPIPQRSDNHQISFNPSETNNLGTFLSFGVQPIQHSVPQEEQIEAPPLQRVITFGEKRENIFAPSPTPKTKQNQGLPTNKKKQSNHQNKLRYLSDTITKYHQNIEKYRSQVKHISNSSNKDPLEQMKDEIRRIVGQYRSLDSLQAEEKKILQKKGLVCFKDDRISIQAVQKIWAQLDNKIQSLNNQFQRKYERILTLIQYQISQCKLNSKKITRIQQQSRKMNPQEDRIKKKIASMKTRINEIKTFASEVQQKLAQKPQKSKIANSEVRIKI